MYVLTKVAKIKHKCARQTQNCNTNRQIHNMLKLIHKLWINEKYKTRMRKTNTKIATTQTGQKFEPVVYH